MNVKVVEIGVDKKDDAACLIEVKLTDEDLAQIVKNALLRGLF